MFSFIFACFAIHMVQSTSPSALCCPHGMSPWQETSGMIRRCSNNFECPATHHCTSVADKDGTTAHVCCPTKAYTCVLAPTYGTRPCFAQPHTLYYFNVAMRRCEQFTYSGCGINAGNSFTTAEECYNFCSATACPASESVEVDQRTGIAKQCHPVDNRICSANSMCRFAALTQTYVCCGNHTTTTVATTVFTPTTDNSIGCSIGGPLRDWKGELVRCTSSDQCPANFECNKYTCCPTKWSPCLMPVSKGTACGGEPTFRWYFEPVERSCRTFEYLGCEGNANNFLVREDCERSCLDAKPTNVSGRPVDARSLVCPDGQAAAKDGRSDHFVRCILDLDCPFKHECVRVSKERETFTYCCPFGKVEPYNPTTGSTVPLSTTTYRPPTSTSTTAATSTQSNVFTPQAQVQPQAQPQPQVFAKPKVEPTHEPTEPSLCLRGQPARLDSGHPAICSADAGVNGGCASDYECVRGVCCMRKQTVCNLPLQTGTCKGNMKRYWYDVTSDACVTFTYSGCGGNENAFESLEQCKNYCEKQQVVPKCIRGDAYKDFVYGVYWKCSPRDTDTCPPNFACYFDGVTWGCCPLPTYTCSMNKDVGNSCGQRQLRWHYDGSTKLCQSFEYMGCDGNSNNFMTKDQCESYCGEESSSCPDGGEPLTNPDGQPVTCSSTEPCPFSHTCSSYASGYRVKQFCCPKREFICTILPEEGEKCTAFAATRYYFDTAARTCKAFAYKGCGGNANNFATLHHCETYCASAVCQTGHAAHIHPVSQQPAPCASHEACPSGYMCMRNNLTSVTVCCGASNLGVCPEGETAFVNMWTQRVKTCNPNKTTSCPNNHVCRMHPDVKQHYCCGLLSIRRRPLL